MTAPVLTSFPEMTASVLAHLLDLVGEPAPLSPRVLLGPAAALPPHALAQLYAGGILDAPADAEEALTPEFRRAARVLLRPRTHLTVRIWGKHPICTETSFVFPARLVDGGGIVFNRTDEFCRISGFANDDSVVGLVARVLPFPGAGAVVPFEAHLDLGAAAALLGVIDLAHRSTNGTPPTADDVAAYVSRNWITAGFGDLIACLVPICQAPDPPAFSELRAGFAWLVVRRVLAVDDTGGYRVAPALASLVDATADLEGGLQWQRVTAGANDGAVLCHRLFLVGQSPLILALAQTTDQRTHVATATRAALVEFVAAELSAASHDAPVRPATKRGKGRP